MPGQSQCCWCWPEKWGLWGQDFLCDVRFLLNCHATWKITVLTTMSLGRFSSRLVFALWWLAKLADSFKESIFSVSVAIWRCSWRNCLSVPTVQETGGLIGVELGILYDSRELERLSGGEVVNEVPSKSEPRHFVKLQIASCPSMSIFCSVSFHQNAWTVLPSWDNRLWKCKTNKTRYQFEIEMIQMFLFSQFSSERLKIALGIDSKSKVTRTSQEH